MLLLRVNGEDFEEAILSDIKPNHFVLTAVTRFTMATVENFVINGEESQLGRPR
jgi:hypothetical protein